MKNDSSSSRRNFIKKMATASAAVTVGANVFAADNNKAVHFEKLKRTPASANDKINIALIGAGGMGTQDVITALQVPNIKIVAACDLYDGRLRCQNKMGCRYFYHPSLQRNFKP